MALIGEMKYLQIGSNTYEIPTSELPIASSSTLGGIKVGSGLAIDSSTGVLNIASPLPYVVELEYVGSGDGSSSIWQSTETAAEIKTKIDNSTVVILKAGNEFFYFNGYSRGASDLCFYGGQTNDLTAQPQSSQGNTWSIHAIDETIYWDDIVGKPTIPTISITRNLTSGTKSATINIDGTDYDIYSETNTDTKVKTTKLDTPDNQYHGIVFGSDAAATEEKYISSSLLFGTSSTNGTNEASLTIGNNYGTNKTNGIFEIVRGSYYITLVPANLTGYRTITLPNKTGTIALTSDIPSAYTSTPSAPGTGSAGSSTSYSKGDHVHPKELPTVSSSDNGKVLTVVSGAWAAASLPIYDGGVS